jgi:hypothetical protein
MKFSPSSILAEQQKLGHNLSILGPRCHPKHKLDVFCCRTTRRLIIACSKCERPIVSISLESLHHP